MKKQKKLEYKKQLEKVEAKEEKLEAKVEGSNPMAAKEEEKEDMFETKRMLDLLLEAEDIKADTSKMERVRKLAGRKATAIKSIQDLKDIYTAKSEAGDFKKKA